MGFGSLWDLAVTYGPRRFHMGLGGLYHTRFHIGFGGSMWDSVPYVTRFLMRLGGSICDLAVPWYSVVGSI